MTTVVKKESTTELTAMDIDEENVPPNQPEVPVQQLMPQYYRSLFPSTEFFKWLSYGNDGAHPQSDPSFFRRREFCLTLQGDIFVRYQSFSNDQDLRTALVNKCPSKIDLGPVYTREPSQRKLYGSEFQPVEREFVIDIDINDYDDIRTCGTGAHICQRCWPLMACGIEVLDTTLREDFGFEHILWVFSGRRGVHCWVCDSRARSMNNEQRSAVLAYLTVYQGVEKEGTKLKYSFPPQGTIKQAYYTLEKQWVEHVLPNQMLLSEPKMQEKVLAMIGDDGLRKEVRATWQNMLSEEDNSVQKWRKLKDMIKQKTEQTKDFKDRCKLQRILFDIVFTFTYPRMDTEVSKKMNHLLKAPFCIHPKTGNVCVPIDPKNAFKFLVDNVPNVYRLVVQIKQKDGKENEGGDGKGWAGTDLEQAMEFFKKQFLQPLVNHNNASLTNKGKNQTGQVLEW